MPPASLRALLLVATVLTAAVVAFGTLAAPGPAPAPVAQRLALVGDAAPTAVSGAGVRARPAARAASDTSRRPASSSLQRTREQAQAQAVPSLEKVAAYDVLAPGRPIAKIPPGPVPGDPFTFQIGTLNVQGSQHRPNGTGRAGMHASTILGRGVDLVGFQEVQDDQLAVLRGRLGGWTIWPGQSLGNQGVRLQIGWRDDMFELVDTGSITTTFDHQRRPIPYVLLRERTTTGEFYVIDVHNSPRDQEADRDAATGAEIALVQQLQATGKPVVILGDTNEKTEFFCRVAAATGMVASNGGHASSGCYPGAGPIKIDWILGTGSMIDFSGHVVDYGAPVRAATDHAFVRATVTVTPLVRRN